MDKNLVKLMDKYIIKEVTYPFLLGVLIVTVILIGNYFFQLADLIIVKNVPVSLVVELLAYRLPRVIVETFPIAVLFSTMTAISRLNRENEITALRMGGVSIYRLIAPLLIVGIIISSLTFLLNEQVVPWANHRSRNIVRETILKDAMPEPDEEVFFKGPKGRLFYVSNYDEESGELSNVIIYQIEGKNDFPEMITAADGEITDNIWLLKKGIIHQYNSDGEIILESSFKNMNIELGDEMQEISGTQKSTSEMSRKELGERIRLFKRSGINVNSLLVDYHLKLAEPLAALLFVLISVPLSLSGKESRTWNLILTIIIIFLYYVVLSFSRSFGRNEILNPLLAAWLPNLVFLVLGIILLFWRESWQKIINKIAYIFGILAAVSLLAFPAATVSAEELYLESTDLNYSMQDNMVKVEGNISGNYGKFFIKSDQIDIKMEEDPSANLSSAEEVNLDPGKISGCDFAQPHYLFDAEKVNIYPGDYMELYNVYFKEFDGKVPLLYWPYLYISLKDEQSNFIPTFGYHERRGWFVKTKYFYNTRYNLPGNFYLDYYTISGAAGGIKQYLIDDQNHELYLYYYLQQNKTDLSDLFNWESELNYQYERDDFDTEFSYLYEDHDEKEVIDAFIDTNYSEGRRRLSIDADYDESYYYDSISRDSKEYGVDTYYRDRFFDSLDLRLTYDIDYDLDPRFGLEREEDRKLYLTNRFDNGWRLRLDYYDGEKDEPNRELLTRWGGEISAEKRYGRFDLELLLERYAPSFSEEDEDKVRFSRLPEINVAYRPAGKIDYLFSYGNYYEDASDTEAHRLKTEAEYSSSRYIFDDTYFKNTHILALNYYDAADAVDNSQSQYYSENQFNFVSNITDRLKLRNEYNYNQNWEESPFEFDEVEKENSLESNLRYRISNLYDLELNTGYDLEAEEYLLLDVLMDYSPNRNWTLSLGSSYDLNKSEFDSNIIFKSIFENNRYTHKLGLEYDARTSELRQLDNKFIYELDTEWGWYIESNLSLDYKYEDEIREGNIQIKRNLHCRELAFSYDYVNEEYTIQYSINLFPSQGIGVTSTEDDMVFDLGIEESLKNEDD